MTTRDALAELDAVVELGRRAPGSDAERRTALHLQDRLEASGRRATIEPFGAFPAWPLALALLAAASAGASVLSVYAPLPGALIALAAATVTYIDAVARVPLVRRVLGRRASQNVHSPAAPGKPGTLILSAHLDAGRGGVVHSDRTARRLTRLPVGGVALLLAAQIAVLACALLRLADVDSAALTVVQLVPTAALLVALALLLDVALSPTRAGENDNASGVVAVLRLAERIELEHFGVEVLLTGAGTAGGAGMRAFERRHRPDRSTTVVLSLDRVGSGEPRYLRGAHPQLAALCRDLGAEGVAEHGFADSPRLPSVTITCRERGTYASGRVEEETLQRVEAFCVELAELLDAEVGPGLSPPGD